MKTNVHNTIMRRVYYAYAIRLATTRGVLQGFAMIGALIALTYFVSIGNVISNFMNIPVRDIGVFFYNAVTTTEAWTLLLLGIIIFSALSLRVRVGDMGEAHTFVKV